MSNKAKAMVYISIMVVALAATVMLYIMMPACDNCGRKFCFGTCTISYNLDDPVQANPQQPELPRTNQTTTRLVETDPVDLEEYFESVYLIGDSRTNALQLYNVPLDRIFAQDGLNHQNAMTEKVIRLGDSKAVTIPDAVSYAAPEIMIVNFGINGIAWWSVEDFIESYKIFVDTLADNSPTSIIVIESVLPVALSYEQSAESNGLTNEKIDEVNALLYKYAQQNGFYYLATNEVMKNEYNDLKREYSDDGLHFTKAGYQAVLDYILSHAVIKQ